jgi:hypothetical protein
VFYQYQLVKLRHFDHTQNSAAELSGLNKTAGNSAHRAKYLLINGGASPDRGLRQAHQV